MTIIKWQTKNGETMTTNFNQSTAYVFIHRLKQTGNKILSITRSKEQICVQ